MKRLIYILFLLCLAVYVKAEGIYKAGYQDLGTQLHAIEAGAGNAEVISIEDSVLFRYQWTGSSWSKVMTIHYDEIDMVAQTVVFSGDVLYRGHQYILVKGVSQSTGTDHFRLIELSELSWEDISPSELSSAKEVSDLLIHGEELLISGVFTDGLYVNNLLSFKEGEWSFKGQTLTRSLVTDYILDMESYKGSVFACGSFTIDGKPYTVAFLDGEEWKPIDYPPFIDFSLKFGLYRDKLILFGGDKDEIERIHIWDGRQWTTMSEGLNELAIEELTKFVLYGDELYAIGSFSSGNAKASVIKYESSKWVRVLNVELSIHSVQPTKHGLLLTTEESNIQGYHFRHRMLMKKGLPVLYTGYFLDKDDDCAYEPDTDRVFSAVSEWYADEEVRFFADRDGEIAIPLKTDDIHLVSEFSELYRLNCQLMKSRNAKTKDGSFLESKRSLMIHDARAGANVILRPQLSWNVKNGERNKYLLCVKNTGSATLTKGELRLTFSNELTNFQSEWDPIERTDSTAKWEILGLLPEEERCFALWLETIGDDLKNISIKADISSSELDWQTDVSKTDELHLKEGEHPDKPIYKLSAQNEVLRQNTDVLDYKLVFRNETGQEVNHLRFLDTLDAQIRIDPRGIRYISNFPARIDPSYFIDDKGKYRYVLSWELSDINLPVYTSGSDQGFAFVDFAVHLVHENKDLWEVCNQAQIFVNRSEPQKTNVVCNSYSNKLTINVKPAQTDDLRVYPNPSDGNIVIYNALHEPLEFELIDIHGRKLGDYHVLSYATKALQLQLEKGTYIIRTNRGETHRILIY